MKRFFFLLAGLLAAAACTPSSADTLKPRIYQIHFEGL